MNELTQTSFDTKVLKGLRFFEDELSGISANDITKYEEYFRFIPEHIDTLIIQARSLNLLVDDGYYIRLENIRRKSPPLCSKDSYPCSSQESFDKFITDNLNILSEWVNSGLRVYSTRDNLIVLIKRGLMNTSRTWRLAHNLGLTINPEYYSRADAIEEELLRSSE